MKQIDKIRAQIKLFVGIELSKSVFSYDQNNNLSIHFENIKNKPEEEHVHHILDILSDIDLINEINLGVNMVKEIPAVLHNFNNLESVTIRLDDRNAFEQSIKHLDQIKHLNIRLYNNPTSDIPHNINVLTKLKSLTINNFSRKRIAENIFNLPNLEHLSILRGSLEILPLELDNLTSLKKLDLSDNKLSTLPNSITNLKKLQILKLSNNELKSLPEDMSKLQNLEELHLDKNNLSSLQDNLFSIKTLSKLNLGHNKIEKIPNFKLSNLKILLLNNNTIQNLPKHIVNLKNLTKLDLSGNNITTFTSDLAKLNNLEYLNLKDNKITSLPENIDNLKNLKVLDLYNNSLKNLPTRFSKLLELKKLDLSFNKFDNFPKIICNLKNIQEFGFLGYDTIPNSNLPEMIGRKKIKKIQIRTHVKNSEREGVFYKILLVGEKNVGKTTIRNQVEDSVYEAFNFIFSQKKYQFGMMCPDINLQIFEPIIPKANRNKEAFYAGAVGAIIVFDITEKTTFEAIPQWIEVMSNRNQDIMLPIIIIGNKSDLAYEINTTNENFWYNKEEVQKYIKSDFSKLIGYDIPYIELNALEPKKVEKAVYTLISMILKSLPKNVIQGVIYISENRIDQFKPLIIN